jgi:transposase
MLCSGGNRRQLRRWIIDETPQQLRVPFALWTLPLIAQLIERRCGVVLHEATLARLLRRLGLSPQRPVRRAFTRDDEACRDWAETEFPVGRHGRRRAQPVRRAGRQRSPSGP